MDELAREQIHRAYALSEMSENRRLIALSAAWLAHMDYLRGDVDSMIKHLSRAYQQASPHDHAALSRSGLVVADAYHFAGRLDKAQPWYAKARVHATAEGDEATISALMHNMAWLRAANLRQTELCGLERTADGEHALTSADSTLNFDQLRGTSSLRHLVPILRAQILSLLGEFMQALDLYEEHLADALNEGLRRMHSGLLADQAWCRLQVGQRSAAIEDAAISRALIDPNGHYDDRASAHSRLAQLYRAVSEESNAREHASRAAEAWSMHAQLQASMIRRLAALPDINVAYRPT
ncbi:MAG: hypothetical protein WA210_19925 [Burkholderiaceae bacterium]